MEPWVIAARAGSGRGLGLGRGGWGRRFALSMSMWERVRMSRMPHPCALSLLRVRFLVPEVTRDGEVFLHRTCNAVAELQCESLCAS